MNDPSVDTPPTAADALAIIERAQARTGAGLTPDLVLLHGIWGLAYLLAGVLWFLHEIGVVDGIITVAAVVVIGAAAITTSVMASVRGTRGVRSAAGSQAAMYGFSWLIALVLTGVLATGIGAGLPAELRGTVTPALFVFVVGALYLAGGVVWTNWAQYLGGTWTMAVAAVAVFVAAPAHILVLAIGGGGGFVAIAVWFAVRAPRR